jgi:hypothetical protein
MQQRLFRFFVIAILPWVALLAVLTNLWFVESNQNLASNALVMNTSPVSFGIQAIVVLLQPIVDVVIINSVSNILIAARAINGPGDRGGDGRKGIDDNNNNNILCDGRELLFKWLTAMW